MVNLNHVSHLVSHSDLHGAVELQTHKYQAFSSFTSIQLNIMSHLDLELIGAECLIPPGKLDCMHNYENMVKLW